jgi:hypothetical protein
MQYHLGVMGKKVRETFAYADFESLEIYGQPNDELRDWIERVSEGVPFTLHEMHWGALHGSLRPRLSRTDPSFKRHSRHSHRSSPRLLGREFHLGEWRGTLTT